MDIKQLAANLLGKNQLEGNVIKPSVASSDQSPHSNGQITPQTIKALQAVLQSQQLSKIFDVIVTKIEGSTVTLTIPDSPFDSPVLQAEMKSPPPIGTRLTLQLTDDLTKPELKVIAQPSSPQDAVSRNLRTGFQQQRPLTPLLANLAMLAKAADTQSIDLPDAIVESARQFVQQLPHPVQLRTPAELKQALQQAGPYLESTLARQDRPPKNTQAAHSVVTDTRPAANQADKMMQLEHDNRTIFTLSQAMQQQPVKDVKANLLRLAAIIRASLSQQRLQKSLGIEPEVDELDEAMQQIRNFGKNQAKPAVSGGPQSASRPVPLPASLLDPDSGEALVGQSRPATAAPRAANQYPSSTQASITPTVRSQVAQPQGTVQASLANILNQESALDELLGQVEGSLARIQVQQLQTVATEQQQRPVWIMELPVKTEQGIDLFDIRIQRDPEDSRGNDPKAPWTVSLAFDLEKLGPIRAQVMLYGEDRVSTVFWAERQETSTYFNQHLEKLENRFKHVGLEVARVDCRCGKPDSPPPSREPRLVDEKV